MSLIVPILEEITERVALLDLGGSHIKWLEPADARAYVRRGEVTILRSRKHKKLRALKLIAADCSNVDTPIGSNRYGMPHRRETYWNPARVFTFDHMPAFLQPVFTRVLDDVTTTKAA